MMAQTIDECRKQMGALSKLIGDSSELELIKMFENQYQVEAYARKKKSEERNALFKLILKIASEISVISGAISILVEIFV